MIPFACSLVLVPLLGLKEHSSSLSREGAPAMSTISSFGHSRGGRWTLPWLHTRVTSATPGSPELTHQNCPFLLSLIHQTISSLEEQLWKRWKSKWEQQEKNCFSYLTIPVGSFPCQTWIFHSLVKEFLVLGVMVGKTVPFPSQQEMSITNSPQQIILIILQR